MIYLDIFVVSNYIETAAITRDSVLLLVTTKRMWSTQIIFLLRQQ